MKEVVAQIQFLRLDEKLQQHVADYLNNQMKEVFNCYASPRAYMDLLRQTNPIIIYYKQGVEKLFEIKEDNERVSKAIAEGLFKTFFLVNPDGKDQLLNSIFNHKQSKNGIIK